MCISAGSDDNDVRTVKHAPSLDYMCISAGSDDNDVRTVKHAPSLDHMCISVQTTMMSPLALISVGEIWV
jgi:hypothetical protein